MPPRTHCDNLQSRVPRHKCHYVLYATIDEADEFVLRMQSDGAVDVKCQHDDRNGRIHVSCSLPSGEVEVEFVTGGTAVV